MKPPATNPVISARETIWMTDSVTIPSSIVPRTTAPSGNTAIPMTGAITIPRVAMTQRDAELVLGSITRAVPLVAAAATKPPKALARMTVIHRDEADGAKTGITREPSTTAFTVGTPPVAPT